MQSFRYLRCAPPCSVNPGVAPIHWAKVHFVDMYLALCVFLGSLPPYEYMLSQSDFRPGFSFVDETCLFCSLLRGRFFDPA